MNDEATPMDGRAISDDVFELLCLRYCIGEIDGPSFAALCHEMERDGARRSVFVEIAMQIETVREVFESQREEDASLDTGDDTGEVLNEVIQAALESRRRQEMESKANALLAEQLGQQRRERMRMSGGADAGDVRPRVLVIPRMAVWGGLAAAIVLLAVVLWPSSAVSPVTPPIADREVEVEPVPVVPAPVIVAALADSVGAVWADGQPRIAGQPLESGRTLILSAGLARLSFESGAEVIVEAPATFTLDSAARVSLHNGTIVGRCEAPSSKGFVVATPHLTVTDLGTEFGVRVDQADGTDVDVMDGRVVATGMETEGVSRHELAAGQAIRADAGGRFADPSAADPTRYFRDLGTYAAKPRTDGPAAFLKSPPSNLSPHAFESTQHTVVFLERRDLVWQRDWGVEVATGAALVEGQDVDVYYLHFDPVGGEELAGPGVVHDIVLRFDRPILGLITSAAGLYASDTTLGHSGTVYPVNFGDAASERRGMEFNLPPNRDAYWLEDGGHTLRLKLEAGAGIDQMRVVVQSQATDVAADVVGTEF